MLVIPLTGEVPDKPELNAAFSGAVSRVAAVGGADVLDADASLADAAALVGCSPDADGCLDEIAASLGVQEILFGHIEPSEGGAVKVSLTYHRAGQTRDRTFDVAAGDVADQSRDVAREAAALLTGEAQPTEVEPPPKDPTPPKDATPPPVEPAPVEPPRSSRDRGMFGNVRTRTWVALGAGVALSGAGAVFYARASSRQSDIDDAPANTPDDFRHLVDLEDEADRYATTGNALMVAGGAALITGAILVVLDNRSARRKAGVAIVPQPGGATFSVSVELP